MFLKKNKINVAAIVPAYNEGKRIAEVLEALVKTPIFKEIIVVDDASTDDTKIVVSKLMKKYDKIKYLKNAKNMGKAYSMGMGVNETASEIIFFCDADLVGLTPKIVESIINPVLNGEYDMFIGIRSNKMQKTVKLVAIKSGERALKREIWENLPGFYKHRYRIETGLNYFARKKGKIGCKIFPYYQTLKENKYGFFKGFFLRMWMNFDVFIANLGINFYDRFRRI